MAISSLPGFCLFGGKTGIGPRILPLRPLIYARGIGRPVSPTGPPGPSGSACLALLYKALLYKQGVNSMKRNRFRGEQFRGGADRHDFGIGCGIENPHELLGIAAAETDPLVIVDAARTRLDAIRASHGSETNLKRYLLAQIAAARDDMLRFAGGSMGRPCRLADPAADPGR